MVLYLMVFHRTIDQAKALEKDLSEKGEKISLILSLDVSEKELKKDCY